MSFSKMKALDLTAEIEEEKTSIITRVLAAMGVAGAAAGAFVVSYFNPVTAGFFPQCPLYLLTGIHCPGCGLTRAFHALLHGDVAAAIGYNALIPFYAFLLGYLLLSMVFTVIRGRGLPWSFFKPAALYGFLTLALVFAILRNIPVYPLNLLAP